jgi:hypothetical protein
VAVVEDPQKQLEWEARQRPRAAIAALLSAALTLGAEIFIGTALRDVPQASYLESLQRALQPGDLGTQPSLHIKAYEFVVDHAAALIGGNLARALGFVALGFALTFLAAATRARRPQLPRMAVPLALVGALLLAVAYVMQASGISSISSFLDGSRTVDEAQDVGRGSISTTATFVQLGGQLALAVAFVLISLNAMRAGLLTRFLGILGVIVGILTIFPIGPVLVVQPVWLLAVGFIFAGSWPGGVPPAWRTGRAEEWPGAQQAAERRRAARERKGRPAVAPEPAAEVEQPSRSAQSRKKRKRRK